jgi:hypothetical protein
VAVNVDERVRGSRALEPAMLFLNSLFVEVRKRHHCAVASVGCQPMLVAPLLQVFAKNLFTSVTSYGTFAAFEVLAIAQLCLQVCLPPRRSHTPVKSVSIVLKQIYQIQRVYHNVDAVPGPHVATLHSIAHCSAAKSRAVSRVENSTYDARRRGAGMHLSGVGVLASKLALCERFLLLQEGIVSYRRSLALDFFFASMAQRVSMLAFAVRSDAQRIGGRCFNYGTLSLPLVLVTRTGTAGIYIAY